MSFRKLICNLLLNVHPICINKWSHPICTKIIYQYFETDLMKIIQQLLARGTAIHTLNDDTLRSAAKNGNLEVVKLLLDKGADIHAENDDALRSATNNAHSEIIQQLLSRGADIHVKNNEDDYSEVVKRVRYMTINDSEY